jgi:hypothetical protein
MDIEDNPRLDDGHRAVLEELRDVITTSGVPVSTAPELADRLDDDRRGVLRLLEDLAVAGLVESAKPGAKATVWWPSPHPWREPAQSRGRGEAPSEPAREPTPAPEPDAASSDVDAGAGLLEEIEEWLADHPPKTSHGKRAVLEAVRYLRENGKVPTSEIQAETYERADVDDKYAGDRAMWNSIGRYIDDVPGVEKPEYGMWGWAGDDVARRELD